MKIFYSISIGHVYLLSLAALFLVQCEDVSSSDTTAKTYEQSDQLFPNPERGFYVRHSWRPGDGPLDPASLRELRDEYITLIGRSYFIEEYRNSDFPESLLEVIEQDLQAVREAGAKMYFRFRYSVRIGDPDAPLERVLRHIDQLEPIMQDNYDIIAFVQGGFIGAWGEWHASTHDLTTTENMRAILFRLMDVVPERTVGIRYPEAKMRIFETEEPLTDDIAYDGSYRSRAAHLNDCFLASPTDVGTYRIDAEWEKEYLSQENLHLPMGGETCNPRDDAGDRYYCETALKELDQMSWSYLNRDYSRQILDTWVEQGCMDEVKRRLGYRFVLNEGTFSQVVQPGGGLHLDLELVNNGFASPYNPRDIQIILRNTERPDLIWRADLPEDPRFWHSGETIKLQHEIKVPEELPAGKYEILLNLPDVEESLRNIPEYSIRLANTGVWEEETGFNRLHLIEVTSTVPEAPFDGEIKFQ